MVGSNMFFDVTGKEDQALIFGIKCPYCQSSHLFSAVGMQVRDIEGGIQDLDPTLSMVGVDEEEDVVHVRCLRCWEVFGLIPVVKVYKDPGAIMVH